MAFSIDEIAYLDSKAEGEARRTRDGAGDPPLANATSSTTIRKARGESQPAHA